MLIIFDGPDGCGKTTIAKEFVRQHPEISYFKNTSEHNTIKTHTHEQLKLIHSVQIELFLSMIKQINCSVLADRSYPSEIVYSRCFRTIDEDYAKKIDEEHAKIGVKLVFFIKEDHLLNDDEDKLFDNDSLRCIKQGFLQFAKETKCQNIIINTSDENLQKQIETLNNFIYENRNI